MMNVAITGATKGIGRAIAEAFAAEGFNLALCARTLSDLEALREELLAKYPQLEVLVFRADVSKQEQVEGFAEYIKQHWTKLEVLVNNAGVFIPGEVSNEPEGIIHRMMDTNMYSAYHLTRALIPMLKEQKRGHIFNMCSVASKIAYPNGGAYSISKFALFGFTKVLREELKSFQIRVTAVLPGATWSDSWKGVVLPESRLMPASDIASAIVSCYKMSPQTVIEELVLRPQLGDL